MAATKLWKTRPDEFKIPVKAGLKAYGYVHEKSTVGYGHESKYFDFVISDSDPN